MKIGTTTITTTTTTFVTTSAWWWLLLLLLLGPMGGGNNSNHRSKGRSFAIATPTRCEVDGKFQGEHEVICKDESCIGKTITNCKSVRCEGYFACYASKISNAEVLECHGSYSCHATVIKNVDSVSCVGGENEIFACWYAEIVNAEVIECQGSSSCAAAKIFDTGLIVCNGGETKSMAACYGDSNDHRQPFRISGDPLTTCLRCEGAKGCGQYCYFVGGNCNSEKDAEFGTCWSALLPPSLSPSERFDSDDF